MAQRVAAIFHSREAAERAADALMDLGADREHISMLARGEEGDVNTTTIAERRDADDFVEPAREVGDSGAPLTTADDDDAASGAATGMAIGAVAGLAAGAMALLVPGFGLVLAAGPLAWALGGAAGSAAAGAIAGGVFGGLRDVGIEESHARGYEERIRGGDVLLTGLVPSVAEDRILDVLAEHGAEDVSFADDTSTARLYTSPTEAPVVSADYPRTSVADVPRTGIVDRDYATTTPTSVTSVDTTPTSVAPTSATAVGGMTTGMGAAPEVVRGETTRVEGELREHAAADVEPPSPSRASYEATVSTSDRAAYADSVVGATATTGADLNRNIARGEAKQVEGELRDRAADRTANPMDDLAAKAKKAEGKIQEELGEAQETIEPRRP